MNVPKSKIKNKSNSNTKLIAVTAMFAALVTVTTAFIKIPTPLGYSHAGDSIVYLSASVLPAPFGLIASALGGALADLLSGYAQWAVPTAIIKALNALPFMLCALAIKNSERNRKIITLPNLLMLIPTSLVTIGGYFVANTIMYDWSAALAGILPEVIQAGVGASLYIVLGVGLDSIKFKQRLIK